MLQQRIQEINRLNIPQSEKSRMIQEAMRENQTSRAEAVAATTTAQANNLSATCMHYPEKRCSKFYFSCCGVIDPCHWCHRERRCDGKLQIQHIECNNCHTEQGPSNECINCHETFSKNYCGICNIWTEKDITHCDACGFCRVGLPDQLQHCPDCDCCYPIDVIHTHYCRKATMRDCACPICHESTYETQIISCLLPCNHMVHQVCLVEAMRKGHYRCPTCRKSMGDMSETWNDMRFSIQQQPLLPCHLPPIQTGDIVEIIASGGDFLVTSMNPPSVLNDPGSQLCEGFMKFADGTEQPARFLLRELQKKSLVNIQCIDCEERSQTKFHYIGLECLHCGGFNTTRE